MTDMMKDPIMQEAFQAKYGLAAENDMDIWKVAAAIRSYNAVKPPPPTPRTRKLIEGHPVGRSAQREDDGLSEVYAVKQKLSQEFPMARVRIEEAKRIGKDAPLPPAGAHRKLLDGFSRRNKSLKKTAKAGTFRTRKGKTIKQNRDENH